MKKTDKSKDVLKGYILVSLFSALICVSSFITIPSPVPFTMQALSIFCALTILGEKKGTLCIILYIFLGMIGLPVFSGFSGGLGHLLGATGGYVFGFIFTALVYSVITHFFGSTVKTQAVGLICGLLACYISGTLWYTTIHLKCLSLEGFLSSLLICVVPFINPDLIKIAVAIFIGCKLSALKI